MSSRFAIAVVLALTVQSQGVSAQTISGPAEFPPSSFTGTQFIDSRGCVFVRAGVGGTTNWVARVTRDRVQLCGFRPTFGGSAPAPTAPTVMASTPAPAQSAGVPAAEAAPVQVAAAPRSFTLSEICEGRSGTIEGYITADTGAPVNCGAAPAIAVPVPAPDPNAGLRRLTLAQACAEMQSTGRSLRNAATGAPVSCPTAAPVMAASSLPRATGGVIYRGPGSVQVPVSAPARMAQPVISCGYLAQLETVYGLTFPAGTQCTNTTAAVAATTAATTTQTHNSAASYGLGRAIPASNPPAGTQVIAPPEGYRSVWTDGRINPLRGKSGQVAPQQVSTRSAQTQISTRSVAPTATTSEMTHRYVQIGTFAEAANARSATALLTGAGLPAATGAISHSGRAMTVVVAGPFTTQADLLHALATARGAGFPDAFLRR